MAEERGLELDLSLNIDEFEASLMKVDADTQKIMRKMHTELKTDNLKFDIAITGAKAAGNDIKAYQLELEKLNHTYKAQEATVNALQKRLNELNNADEKNETLIKQVSSLLDKETLKLNKQALAIKKKQDAHEASIEAAKKAAQAEIEAAEKAEKIEAKRAERAKKQAEAEAEKIALMKKAEAERARIQQQADARESRSLSVSNVDLGYQVDIKNAKNAGEYVKAYKLELDRLNATYKAQEQQAKALTSEIERQSKATGNDSLEVKRLKNELLNTKSAMADTEAQIKALNGSLLDKAIAGIGKISPNFANAITMIREYKKELSALLKMSQLSSKALAGIGIGTTALIAGAGYSALSSITDKVKELGNNASKAYEPIYLLREELGSTYEEAEMLHGVMALDGIAGETFGQAINKLNKLLLNAGENGNLASDMLKRFNVELRNGDGSRKTTIEQLRELAAGYQRASKAGAGMDFLTATGTRPLVHILSDLDGYIARWENINVKTKKNADLLHLLEEMNNHVTESERQLALAKGEVYTPEALRIKEAEIKANIAEAKIIEKNKKEYEEFAKSLGDVAIAFTELKLAAELTLKKIFQDDIKNIEKFSKNIDELKKEFPEAFGVLGKFTEKVYSTLPPVVRALIDEFKKQKEEVKAEIKKVPDTKLKQVEDKPQRDPQAEREAERIEKQKAEFKKKIAKEIRDLDAKEYDRQINRLKDEVEANIKAGADVSDAWYIFYRKKDELDKKQYDEAKKRLDEEKKTQEELIKKRQEAETSISNVFLTETEKRIQAIKKQRDEWVKAGADEVRATQAAQKEINEARMTEMEKAVQDYKKLADYAVKLRKQGKYSDEAINNYSEKLQYERMGFNKKDVQNVAEIGTDTLKRLMEQARVKILEPLTGSLNMFQQQKNAFQQGFGFFNNNMLPEINQTAIQGISNETRPSLNVNAPITVNFDNTVVEDVTSLQKIADKVAGVIQPAIENALRGDSYGY